MHDRPIHILVTEDDTALQAMLRDLLEGEGYRVSLASAQSLDDVVQLAPDLILLDWWNYGTGLRTDFLDNLKTDRQTAAIPVIILTGATREVAEHAAHFAGIDVTVVEKPFDVEDLLVEIRRRLA